MKDVIKKEIQVKNSNLPLNYKEWIKEFMELLDKEGDCYLSNEDNPEERELVIGVDRYPMEDYERLEHLYYCYWVYDKEPNLSNKIEKLTQEVNNSLQTIKN